MASTALHGRRTPTLPTRGGAIDALRVRLRRLALDRALADGAAPTSSPQLALRAAQLRAPRVRLDLAERIDAVVRDAARPQRALTARAPLQRAEIKAARQQLANLAQSLREIEHPRAEGVARVLMLVSDGAGPLFSPSLPGTLAAAAWRAADALSEGPTWI